MPRPSPLPADLWPKVIEGYLAGESTHALAERFNCVRSTISRTIKRSGASMRTVAERVPRLPCRHDAFARAEDDPDAAYWVGVLMSDGCIGSAASTRYVILKLSEVDRGHVEAFRMFLQAKHRILKQEHHRGNTRPMYGLSVGSAQLVNDLARYGVVPRKTKSAKVQLLADNRHFWRGVIDGDGSLGYRTRRKATHSQSPLLQINGSEPLMRQFEAYARHVTGTSAKAHTGNRCWSLALHAGAAAEMISHLYTDCAVALPRKWALAHELLCEWELRPNRRDFTGRRAAG